MMEEEVFAIDSAATNDRSNSTAGTDSKAEVGVQTHTHTHTHTDPELDIQQFISPDAALTAATFDNFDTEMRTEDYTSSQEKVANNLASFIQMGRKGAESASR
jgi:hypothetical protein